MQSFNKANLSLQQFTFLEIHPSETSRLLDLRLMGRCGRSHYPEWGHRQLIHDWGLNTIPDLRMTWFPLKESWNMHQVFPIAEEENRPESRKFFIFFTHHVHGTSHCVVQEMRQPQHVPLFGAVYVAHVDCLEESMMNIGQTGSLCAY